MKNIKKLASILLALMMILSATTVLATETTPATGSITINGVSEGNVYSVYRLLNLESYDSSAGKYAYKVNGAWEEFFASEATQVYFSIDEAGYVTWAKGEDKSGIADFAKSALAYAESKGITPEKSSANAGEFTIENGSGTFTGLTLGYYLVDSTMGALCGLTTTNPNASIQAKNQAPTLDKQVKEDLTGNWGSSNSADIGQVVEFRTTINVHAGAENYVLHDKMSDGLDFDPTSVKVHLVTSGSSQEGNPVNSSMYTVKTTEQLEDDCTFEVEFTKDFCDSLKTNDRLLVTYSAVLNADAVIADEGNPNESWLDFGEDHHTTHDQTTTMTYSFDIVKTDNQNQLISGAEFRIYDAVTGGKEIPVVYVETITVGEGESAREIKVYRRALSGEAGEPIVVDGGQVRVLGFDNGDYYLEETKAPAGYNKLTSRKDFTIADKNLVAVFNGNTYSTGSGVQVINNSGAMLPETGGMGTTLFYACGGALVLAAVVLLVTKKRMSNAE